jgi:hypothetical protein
MKAEATPLLILILISLAFGPGCITPQGGGGTQVPTGPLTPVGTTITTVPPTPVVTIPPGPVVTTRPYQEVIVQVMKNPSTANPYISVAFRGGSGQYILSKITVTVSRSDGQVIQKTIPQSVQGRYAVGDTVTIPGTTGADEVAVVATILGVDYKIYDQNLAYGSSP